VLRRLLGFAGLVAVASLLVSAEARRQVNEALRDLSDRLMMMVLRTSSGFASDVSRTLQEEERERRLRWQ
jgi:hypothetical protein